MKVGWWQLVSFNDREAANYKVTDLLASVTKGGRLDLHNSFLPFLSPTPYLPSLLRILPLSPRASY